MYVFSMFSECNSEKIPRKHHTRFLLIHTKNSASENLRFVPNPKQVYISDHGWTFRRAPTTLARACLAKGWWRPREGVSS